jgi:hypothetical protein
MPCTGGPSREDEQRSEIEQTHKRQLAELQTKNHYLEGCLCAILTEVESEGRVDMIVNAEEKGEVDISLFWNSHKDADKTRLINDLKKYSEHERSVLRDILNT